MKLAPQLRRRLVPVRDDQGSMFLALLLVIMGLALLLTTAAYVDQETRKSKSATGFSAATEAANSGIQQGLYSLNACGSLRCAGGPPSASNPATGTAPDGSTWSYYGSSTVQTDGTLLWNVTSTGTSGKKTQVATGTYQQQPTGGIPWPDGVFGVNSVTIQRGSLSSYIPSVGLASSDTAGTVGSDGSISLGTGVSYQGYHLGDYSAAPNANRCVTPSGVCTVANNPEDNYVNVDNSGAINRYKSSCSGTPSAWTASTAAAPGVLPAGVQCYSSMNFNTTTVVNGTPSNPTILIVSGPITVGSGVSVNTPSAYRPSEGLIIYSSGAAVTVAGTMTAAISAPAADCTFNSATAISFYGAVTCKTVTATGTAAASFYIDQYLLSDNRVPTGIPTYTLKAHGLSNH